MRKLATAALSFGAGVALAHYILPENWVYPCSLLLAILIIPALFFGGSLRLRSVLLLFFTAMGILWYTSYVSVYVEPAGALAGEEHTVTMRVLESPEIHDKWARVYVKLEQEGYPPVKLAVYDYDGYMTELSPGDLASFSVKFVSATKLYDEHTDIYASRGILLRAYLRAEPEPLERDWRAILYAPALISREISKVIEKIFPEDVRGFVKALLVGDAAELNEDLVLCNALSVSGIRHVVSVSGMHLSFLYGAISTVVGRKRVTWFGIPAIVFYMLITGCTASVVRSAVMLIMVMLAPVFGRESDGITSLSTALFILLLVNPMSISAAGLQLSFAAMAGILLVSPRVYAFISTRWKKPKKRGKRLYSFVVSSVSSSVGAIIFTTPLTAANFGIISLISPVANLLCLWAVSIAFLGGWIAVVMGFVWTSAGALAAWCVAWAGRYIVFSGGLMATLPYAAVYTINDSLKWWLFFSYCGLGYCCFSRRKSKYRVAVVAAVSLLALLASVSYWVYYANSKSNITVMDVGQGQSVIALSEGKTIVVDCGGGGMLDNAGDVAAEYLETFGRRSIDVLALTHLHGDHVNGVAQLMGRIKVSLLYLPGDVEDPDGMLDNILAMAKRRGTEVKYISQNVTVPVGDMNLTIYEPFGEADLNERGVIMKLQIKGVETLITGDVGMDVEREFIESVEPEKIEILVVGHHGSKYSTSRELLEAINAEVAVISVGFNSYGHPTDEVLYRLEMAGITVYRTDMDGNVVMRISNDG